MSRPTCISFACVLILATPALAETDGEVYEEVDKIMAEASDGVRANLATFIEANERPLGKARSELAELIARLNKDGRSQLATSIQKRVNTLEDTVQKRASAKVPIVQPPQKPLLERLAGKWEWVDTGYALTIDGAGDAVYADRDASKVYCQGRVTVDSANRATIGWRCPHWFMHVIDDDTVIAFEGSDWNHGKGRLLKRIK